MPFDLKTLKNDLFRLLKIFPLFLIVVMFSCKKESEIPLMQKGSLYGKVVIKDRYGNRNPNFNDLNIEVINSLNEHRVVELDTSGSFFIDSIMFGKLLFKFDKPGYGVIETLSFGHFINMDTLSTIYLAEELPFYFNVFTVIDTNQWITFHRSTAYQTNDTYLIKELLCFGKSPNVSINNCAFFVIPDFLSQINMVNWRTWEAFKITSQEFASHGLYSGNLVYAVCYPIGYRSASPDFYATKFDIQSYKLTNPSVAWSFVIP
jgi:hypothetical protein